MTTATHAPPAATDSDYSDDEDLAFACMDFDGVDFGDDTPIRLATVDEIVIEDDLLNPGVENSDVDKEAVESDIVSDHIGELPSSVSTASASTVCGTNTTGLIDEIYKQKATLGSIFTNVDVQYKMSANDEHMLVTEQDVLLPNSQDRPYEQLNDENDNTDLNVLFRQLNDGAYADMLRSPVAQELFGSKCEFDLGGFNLSGAPYMMENIKLRALNYFSTKDASKKSFYVKCLELELIGIASLNLFLQLNYTGPSMDRGMKPEESHQSHTLDGIHPHGMFETLVEKVDSKVANTAVSSELSSIAENEPSMATTETTTLYTLSTEPSTNNAFHNTILSELACDGEWPFQVSQFPYFLLTARAILSLLAEPTRPFRNWAEDNVEDCASASIAISNACDRFAAAANNLIGATLWNARAIVAHRRLMAVRRDDDDGSACPTLWKEADAMYQRCVRMYCEQQKLFQDDSRNSYVAASVMLEWGLAQHHFRTEGRGKASFNMALSLVRLEVEVTGAEGKRTKYQKTSTAQILVRAKPNGAAPPAIEDEEGFQRVTDENDHIKAQMIKHDDVSDDALLLEKIKFEEEQDNAHHNLSILEQSILLALCLDVKNNNPMDGLTGEQMGGFLARVLNQHDDWMVYSTALLERAWLECERTHGRERAILQIQALADQHSNRLTITQSTFKSVEEDSAPAQDRLRNLHSIVYPPRWDMLRDLAERYAKLGVVTSAAEIFEELELWDEVVECYRIAGKQSKAEEVVRKRLSEKETPRMYAALGDLTNDPKCFERSLELSRGKFYDAHIALGKFYFDKGDSRTAMRHYLDALATKPLMPAVWFRVGTIGMQLKEWDIALRAFTEVVQQQPDEGDAWANVAAVHMYRKNPEKAYHALQESLKQNRNNWRVWVSKLYTCIDLKKYDEAIQACNELVSLKARRNESEKVPMIEEKCIRAITSGSLRNYKEAISSGKECLLDSSKRTLHRLRELLDKMQETMKSDAWLYEVSAHLNIEMGWKEDVITDLMKEYRIIQSEKWEQNAIKLTKMVELIKDIFQCHKKEGTKESLSKCKLLINGAKRKILGTSDYNAESAEFIAVLDLMIKQLDEGMHTFKSK